MKLKICGITIPEQALEIASMGVDTLGFIFYPKSPRYIQTTSVFQIIQKLPVWVKTVGVVVNESIENLKQIYDQSGVDTLQLHGEEKPEFCEQLTKQQIQWYKAFRVNSEFNFQKINHYNCSTVLFDAWSNDAYGGTGKTFDWNLMKQKFNKNIILAGGINLNNINDILKFKFYGLDISSGVEEKPGIKSLSKIKAIFNKLNFFP